MKDNISRFTDPAVDIKVDFPSDTVGRKFVVIRIFPFKEVPIISKAGIQGELMYTTSNLAHSYGKGT